MSQEAMMQGMCCKKYDTIVTVKILDELCQTSHYCKATQLHKGGVCAFYWGLHAKVSSSSYISQLIIVKVENFYHLIIIFLDSPMSHTFLLYSPTNHYLVASHWLISASFLFSKYLQPKFKQHVCAPTNHLKICYPLVNGFN